MSVISSSENGFLVDHQMSITESVSPLSLSCKDCLFALFEPYFRISCDTRKRKRKKSSKSIPIEEDSATDFEHQKVKEIVTRGLEQLVKSGVHYFKSSTNANCEEDLPEDNTDLTELLRQCHSADLLPPITISTGIAFNDKDVFNRVITHPGDTPALFNVFGSQYVLPVNCSFLMSDACNLKPLVTYAQNNGLYNLAILDPPWFNKSARRSSKYSFMSLWQIKSLPVPQLLVPGALVGVWVTNKQKYLRFTKTELFPHWSVELVAEWYWVKVTRMGELVTDLDSPHKKPYETLLIGRYRPQETRNKKIPTDTKEDRDSRNSLSESVAVYKTDLTNLQSRPNERQKRKTDECYTHYGDNMTKRCEECHMDFQTKRRKRLAGKCNCTKEIKQGHLSCSTVLSETNQLFDSCKLYSENVLKTQGGNNNSSFCNTLMHGKDNEYKGRRDCKGNCCEAALNIGDSNCASTGYCQDIYSLHGKDLMYKPLPYYQVICSVPCRLHSRKPPLTDILRDYLPLGSLCLEMFARNLTPNWTSWGNEVLKFQSIAYFD